MNPMLVIAKETLNLLRDEYRKIKDDPKQTERQIDLVKRGEAVKRSIEIMEKVLENKPKEGYKTVGDMTVEEAENIFK